MDEYFLNVDSEISVGGYLSSEQIDLLSIIQCEDIPELIEFITNCDQINHIYGIVESIEDKDIEDAKKYIFEKYKSTMVDHNSSKEEQIDNVLKHFKVNSIEEATDEEITLGGHFVSKERDQIKSITYDEMELLNSKLDNFDSILIGSGKIYNVYNNKNNKFDFYHVKRDLDFAAKNNKQVRYHSLLVKEAFDLLEGKILEEKKELIKEYVKRSINYITEYNDKHKVIINGEEKPVINAIDLFNEIISFEKNDKNEYYNIWEDKYGIPMEDLMECFKYAYDNKPEGVSFLYNEVFLEDKEKRDKVFYTLKEINSIYPGLIDTLGTQMHITIGKNLDDIEECFRDFKELQEEMGINIQITEFDMSLGRYDIQRVFGEGKNTDLELENAYNVKSRNIADVSEIIRDSEVKLKGISYWSLTDTLDHNLERHRENLKKGKFEGIKEIETACGGLFPTYKKIIKNNELQEMLNEEKEEKSSSKEYTL